MKDIGKQLITALEVVQSKWDGESEKRNLVENRSYNRASSLGWTQDCIRYLVMKRIYPEQEIITPQQRKRMREGYVQEKIMGEELDASGVETVKAEVLLWPEYNIKGEVEKQIKMDGEIIPVDFKSCSSAIFREVSRCQTSEDLLRSRFSWVRHYPAQMTTYDHLYDRKNGLLLFKNKESGEKHPVIVPKNDTFMSLILDGVTMVNEFVKKRELPQAVWVDSCKGCGYAEACWKPDDRQQDIKRVTDQDLEVLLHRREALIQSVKEYEDIDEMIKQNLKLIGGTFQIGDFKVDVTTYQKKSYEVPEEIKKQYQKIIDITRTNIRYLGGAL